jgi:hypothetical protein
MFLAEKGIDSLERVHVDLNAGEHRSVAEAIEQCWNAIPAPGEAAAVETVIARLLAHMADEEQKVLHPHVLTDEIGPIDPFGG